MDISELISLAKGDPQKMYDRMLQENPQFKSFVDKNKGKTPEEIARENNIDPVLLNLILK